MMRAPKLRRIAGKAGFALSLFVLVSPAILVFLWMLSLSLKNDADNTAFPPIFIPDPPTLDNFRDVFAKNNFLLYFWNSILVTGGAVLVGLLVGVPAG
ncbi:MAG: carbohydrate ABC transporter permease, partial [Hyphomicrobiales bacterium]|nr:carbohydrate ABC transporter permease [Hyphomicrobiales bacterium]